MTIDDNARPGRTSGTGEKQAGQPEQIVPPWAEVYGDAERWVRWTARRRWPGFAANDEVWACSVADWATSGGRSAA